MAGMEPFEHLTAYAAAGKMQPELMKHIADLERELATIRADWQTAAQRNVEDAEIIKGLREWQREAVPLLRAFEDNSMLPSERVAVERLMAEAGEG